MSNNNTNANKVYNGEIKGAEKNGRTVTKLEDRAEIRDTSGELIKILMKPRKRTLNEFLPPDLAQSPAAKVKRARGSRRGAGASPSPAALFVTAANGGLPAQNIAAANTLPAIEEHDEPIEAFAVQASASDTPLDDFHTDDEHFEEPQSNTGKSHDDHRCAENINAERSSLSHDQSGSDLDNANYGGITNTGKGNTGMNNPGYGNAGTNYSGINNPLMDNGYIHNMDNAYLDTSLNNIGPNVAQNGIGQSNAGDAHPPQPFPPYHHGLYPIPNQSSPPSHFGSDPSLASLQPVPGTSASVTLTSAIDPFLEDYSNRQ